MFPVILEGGSRGTKRTARAKRRLHARADGLLEGVAFDVLDESEVERDKRQDPAIRPGLRHGVGLAAVTTAKEASAPSQMVLIM